MPTARTEWQVHQGSFTTTEALARAISVTGEVSLFVSPKRKLRRNWSTFRYWSATLMLYFPGATGAGTTGPGTSSLPSLAGFAGVGSWLALARAAEQGIENCTVSE